MKTIGLIGGMSWESTAHYYAALNRGMKERLRGRHSAKILLYSIDFEELATLQHAADGTRLNRWWWMGQGDWKRAVRIAF